MATISESDLSKDSLVYPCSLCEEYDGDLWLCGEGAVCARCFANAAGLPLSEVLSLEEQTEEARKRAKANLLKEEEDASS